MAHVGLCIGLTNVRHFIRVIKVEDGGITYTAYHHVSLPNYKEQHYVSRFEENTCQLAGTDMPGGSSQPLLVVRSLCGDGLLKECRQK